MRKTDITRITERRSITILLILFMSSQIFSQINVDNRSFEPVPWFDSLYKNSVSIQEHLLSDKRAARKTDQEILYREFINPLLLETYKGMTNDLEKRKMYWEVGDHIWSFSLLDTLTTRLARNYTESISRDFSLWKYAMKIGELDPDETDLRLIRQIYTLDKYNTQLDYIGANYTDGNKAWTGYKHKYYSLIEDISVLLNSYLSDKLPSTEALNSSLTELNDLCEVMPVRLPSTPLEPGSFGAFYTNLKYYPDWDSKWRVAGHPDVVVQFPDNVHKFVFWRGTNYIPHWVTEKGFWFNNEFNETWFSEGSAEPMSDKQCRYSHVRIIESNDARVVVHWRYALNDVNYEIAWPDAYTGWGDWTDEYYFIYPDAVSVRKVILHTSYAVDDSGKSTDEEGHEWQEGIVVYHPHTRPEDYLHIDAVHVANMKGESGKWSWERAGKPTTPTPEGSNIVMMNMKSELKPFIISGEGCELAAYEGAQGGSHFRWRDHWPTTTEPTPGRNASGKQAAHGSFFHVLNIPYYEREPNKLTKVMLHGLTRTPVEGLVPVAGSWLNPPDLELMSQSGQVSYEGYDQSERAYVLRIHGESESGEIRLQIDADPDKPAVNPVLILNNWSGERPGILLNGSSLEYSKEFTSGIEKGPDNARCVLWLNKQLTGTSLIVIQNKSGNSSDNHSVIDGLKKIASTEGFKPYECNPVVTMGPEGSWDAGALGSMTLLQAGGVFHLYYESWGVRSEKEWDASEYESLQIGHATSKDGIHWTKDPNNPVLPQGGEGDFDRTGVWDPYVIYQNGQYKMWYGGGGGSEPNFGWAYAHSKDGSHFNKRGLIGIGNQSGVEDCHVVYDEESGLYYMYYWHGWDEPEGLFLVTSPTETGFDFNEAVNIHIDGDESYMKKFGQVLRDENGWHMFYSNFVQPHCPNSITRYAYSEDGIHWQAKNKRLLKGHDSEVMKVADDLYLMLYSPQNGFDRKGCDIRLAVYHGSLTDLASKPPFIPEEKPTSLVGKSLVVHMGEDPPLTFAFKTDGEVVLSEEGDEDDAWTFNAYFVQDGDHVHIMGENLDLKGIFNGQALLLTESNE